MNILMIARDTLFSTPGGDTTQIEMTCKYLRLLGIQVDIHLTKEELDYSKYDLIHFFNIIRPGDILPHIDMSIPYVVSTIFVDYSEYERKCRKGIIKFLAKVLSDDQLEYFKAIGRFLVNGQRISSMYYLFNGHEACVKKIAEGACLLLPNSKSEYLRFVNKYEIHSKFVRVVNAVDSTVFNQDVAADESFRDHIICVGRIEGIKNQLNLIKALADTPYKLTIIGKASPNHKNYFLECERLANLSNNIQIIEHVDHFRLGAIYQAAKVHVLPSWFETTGLSSLEAGVMSCNLVMTRKGDTEEYFGDYAFYCEPDDLNSIRKAVSRAYNAPINRELAQFISDNYTWKQTAQQTLSAYKSVLSLP